jgi:hypothetical protein
MNIEAATESSILILADGRILARNVTPAVAAVLLALQPDNAELALRAGTPAETAAPTSKTP